MHYRQDEWMLYKQGRVAGQQRRAMEEHLAACNACLAEYLGTVELRDEELAELLLSQDFTRRLMRRLPPGEKGKHSFRRKALALQYYAVAAAVTLLLMTGGWFETLAHKVPLAFDQTGLAARPIEERLPFGWSEQVTNYASSRIDRMLAGKEELR